LQVIAAFSEKCGQIRTVFTQIDQIELLVGRTKDSLKNLESAVALAETELNKKK